MFIFNLNGVFTTHVLKVAPIRVRFSLVIPPGGGFHGEEFAPAWFETMT
jgi:succinylglutamate desuccinylase